MNSDIMAIVCKLQNYANKCDKQCAENRNYGWSTNSNGLLTDMANELRRVAAALELMAKKGRP